MKKTGILFAASCVASMATGATTVEPQTTPPRTVIVPAPVVTITCSTCTTLASLTAAAQSYSTAHMNAPAPGFPITPSALGNITYYVRTTTQALVTSTKIPISATYKFSSPVTATTATTDLGAYNLDGVAFARANNMPIIKLPVPYDTDPDSLIATAIQNVLRPNGAFGNDSLWNLLQGQLTIYYVLVSTADGQSYKVHVGDEQTFEYPDGSTEKWKFLGVHAGSIQWQKVPGTLRKPTGPKPGTSQTTSPPAPGGGFQVSTPSGAFPITVIPFTDTLVQGQITVGPPIPGTEAFMNFYPGGGWFGTCDCSE